MADGVSTAAQQGSALEAQFLAQIDWQRPWLRSVLPAAQSFLAAAPSSASAVRARLSELAAQRALCNCAGLPLQFVEQACLPSGCAYESFIFEQGQVPTRDNLHDFFNALVWLSFPQIKKELNRLQAAHIRLHGVGQQRGALRDAATLFDENAALLLVADDVAGQALAYALQQHQWQEFFPRFTASAQLYLFGHALMEKLVQPYKAITAHSWLVPAPPSVLQQAPAQQMAWLDSHIAAQLQQAAPVPANFQPLPIAGIPGWWAGQDQAFYDDVSVFRPARKNRVSVMPG
ncbi:MAG: DUF3025 domain-containing protein [Burkholderiales bacterium]|nr:DUF3025 domain-containing protein [Burkholderiales bacterium]